MNRYRIVNQIDDIGVTVIENAFINHYMPSARGDYVKVYLYGLKCAHTDKLLCPKDSEMAADLKMTEIDVVNAWKYWEEEGIISIIDDGTDKTIEFYNVSSLLFTGKRAMKKPPKPKPRIEQMFRDIEDRIARPLSHSEMDKILSWTTEYRFSPQTCVLLIEDCIKREKRSINYWEVVASGFRDEGITTYDEALTYLQTRDGRWQRYKEILNYLGLFHAPAVPERTMMDKWLDEYGFDIDTIKKAAGEVVATSRPNLQYVDIVLSAWHSGQPTPQLGKRASKKSVAQQSVDERNYDMAALEKLLSGEDDEN